MYRIIIAILISLCFIGCEKSSELNDLDKNPADSLQIPYFSNDTTGIKISIQLIPTDSIPLKESSMGFFFLYGLDNSVNNAPSSLIKADSVRIDTLPYEFTYYFPEKPDKYIAYQDRNSNDYSYYISFYLDINGDFQICQGDYSKEVLIDENNTFTTPPDTMVMYVSELAWNNFCLVIL